MTARILAAAAVAWLGLGCVSAPPCTRAKTLFDATCDVSEEIAQRWGELAPGNRQKCRFKLRLGASGELLGREVIECENVKLLDRALERAAPFKVPCDSSLLERVQAVSFGVN